MEIITFAFGLMIYFGVMVALAEWLDDRQGFTMLWGIWLPPVILMLTIFLFQSWIKRLCTLRK